MSISPWARPQKKMMRERCGEVAGAAAAGAEARLAKPVTPAKPEAQRWRRGGGGASVAIDGVTGTHGIEVAAGWTLPEHHGGLKATA